MKRLLLLLILSLVVLSALFFLWRAKLENKNTNVTPPENNISNGQNLNNPAGAVNAAVENSNNSNAQNTSGFVPPLEKAGERVTEKPFGVYITSQTSPVQPERFQGYHIGSDFEIFPEELNIPVDVRAVCDGKLLLKESASGYGGVAVETCQLNNQPITVIYGHLKLTSILAKAGDNLKAGDMLGILGAEYSQETDGERKHLHLGFHKGASINIRGYVSSQAELSGWIDPCLYVCYN